MSEDDPVTRRECAAVHAGVGQGIEDIKDKLDELNGAVAENTLFRAQSKAVYGAIAFAWASMMIPLTAIAISVLR